MNVIVACQNVVAIAVHEMVTCAGCLSFDVIIKISDFENLHTLLEHYMECLCMTLIFLSLITVIIIVFHSTQCTIYTLE
jgi:hypothetical protein